ncbi:MAG TPA: flagellar basal body rod protein FlgC [Alphaproteobacteria bacterium]
MELFDAMAISASGMKAQGTRMRVISENLANSETLANTPGGDPYRRKTISFANELDRQSGVNKVNVKQIGQDQSDFRLKYDPTNPAADEKGYVKLPNVNSLIETMDMRESQRSYEASLGSIEISRSMMMRSMDLLRSR